MDPLLLSGKGSGTERRACFRYLFGLSYCRGEDSPVIEGFPMANNTSGTEPPAGYALVADRITLFYHRYPTGRIRTKLHSKAEGEIIFCAMVYRGPDDSRPAATGWAAEREGDGEINEVACLENAETSAVGRALANLGFTASIRRPSAEEMEKAARARTRLAQERRRESHYQPAPPAALDDRRIDVALGNADHGSPASLPGVDALDLIAEAERAGLDGHRAARLREGIEHPLVSMASIARAERALRHWLAAHDPE